MYEIKNAATIVLIRRHESRHSILMGRRASTASFMPNKYVFPGGVWELSDNDVPLGKVMSNRQKKFLMLDTDFSDSLNLGITGIRELWEETGLRLSCKGKFNKFPISWTKFFSGGNGPNLSNLYFFFRAVTPPGRSRRFDTRFFFCSAKHICDDLDDFSKASGELIDLHWIDISKVANLDLPIITRIALDHLLKLIANNYIFDFVPFYTGGSTGLNKKKLKL